MLNCSWRYETCRIAVGVSLFVAVGITMDLSPSISDPRGLTFTWWECWGLCFWHKPTEFAHSFLSCFCVCFCLFGPFNCILFQKFSRQPFVFSLCSFGLISALLVLSIIYLFMKVSLSPDIILCGWLSLKHQLTNPLTDRLAWPISARLQTCLLKQ